MGKRTGCWLRKVTGAGYPLEYFGVGATFRSHASPDANITLPLITVERDQCSSAYNHLLAA